MNNLVLMRLKKGMSMPLTLFAIAAIKPAAIPDQSQIQPAAPLTEIYLNKKGGIDMEVKRDR